MFKKVVARGYSHGIKFITTVCVESSRCVSLYYNLSRVCALNRLRRFGSVGTKGNMSVGRLGGPQLLRTTFMVSEWCVETLRHKCHRVGLKGLQPRIIGWLSIYTCAGAKKLLSHPVKVPKYNLSQDTSDALLKVVLTASPSF